MKRYKHKPGMWGKSIIKKMREEQKQLKTFIKENKVENGALIGARLRETDRLSENVKDLITEYERLAEGDPPIDRRWLAISKTHFQEGFMALRRAVGHDSSF